MMGYDEPASKRPAVGLAPGPELDPPKRRWAMRIGLLSFALLGGAYFASQSNSDDPLARLKTIVADPMKAIGSIVGGETQGRRGGRGGGPAPPVRVATAEVKDIPVTVHTIGTVLANSVVNIKSQVDGPLMEAHFKEGQMVKQGDLLLKID